MDNLFDKALNFIEDKTVFSIALFLAIVSCFFVFPSMNYFNYINWNTIILLLVIMVIVEILKNLAVFEVVVRKLLSNIVNTRELLLILVFTCFLSSIFITNDVSLIIFVPFSIMALKKVNRSDLIVVVVCLQTIAANVGCMLLPTGSPHNIVLYTVSNISFESFFFLLLPYVIISCIFLVVVLLFVPNDDIFLPRMDMVHVDRSHFLKKIFLGVDYYLLFTFIALFILIGNLENMPFFNSLFKQVIVGHELLCGIFVSQVISNVPAAMLLTGFSSNIRAIAIGINIGGFGTLIASMANLISYDILIREYPEFKVRYLIVFTVLNVILLVILLFFNQSGLV